MLEAVRGAGMTTPVGAGDRGVGGNQNSVPHEWAALESGRPGLGPVLLVHLRSLLAYTCVSSSVEG